MDWIKQFFQALWSLTVDMAPYILLGFLIAGLLNGVFSKEWMQRRLGKPGWWSAMKASILGVPLPLCSCGVIPTGVSFHKQGASKGATNSFLISTPQTGVDSILVTYSMMGWAYAIARPIIAFITGILGGIWTDRATSNNVAIEQSTGINCETNPSEEKEHWFQRIFVYAFVTFMQDIGRWLIIGLVLAAIITVAVPDDFFAQHLNSPIVNMLLILVASIPMYVCATGSVPIAAALLMKGISPGAALVFLMAGPATNIATFTVLWQTLGKRTTVIYLVSIILGALFFGIMIDYALPQNIVSYFTLSSGEMHHHAHEHHILPHWMMIASGVVLVYLLIQAEILRYIPKKSKIMENTNDKQTFHIEGMTCNHCVANVDKHLKNLEGVQDVAVDLQKNQATIIGNVSIEKVQETVDGLGYSFKGKVE